MTTQERELLDRMAGFLRIFVCASEQDGMTAHSVGWSQMPYVRAAITEYDALPSEGNRERSERTAEGDSFVRTMGERIIADGHANDHCTRDPMFMVHKRVRRVGIDPDYADEHAWLHDSEEVTDTEELASLNIAYEAGEDVDTIFGGGYVRTGVVEAWEYYAGPWFTKESAEAFMAAKKHEGDLRMYVDSGCRNYEWQAARALLVKIATTPASASMSGGMTDAMVKYMVNRFLSWRLPNPWHPDAGISYTRPNYAHAPADHDWPLGTNLFDATQAEAMVRYMLEGAPIARHSMSAAQGVVTEAMVEAAWDVFWTYPNPIADKTALRTAIAVALAERARPSMSAGVTDLATEITAARSNVMAALNTYIPQRNNTLDSCISIIFDGLDVAARMSERARANTRAGVNKCPKCGGDLCIGDFCFTCKAYTTLPQECPHGTPIRYALNCQQCFDGTAGDAKGAGEEYCKHGNVARWCDEGCNPGY